jgi:acetyl-CoA carboxylase biotin carboxyl carrier protein
MVSKEEKPAQADSDKPAGSPEVQRLQDLYELMIHEGLDSLELKDQDGRIRLSRRVHATAAPMVVPRVAPRSAESEAPSEPATPEAAPDGQNAIVTPLAGVFYRASSPTTAPFVKEGDAVEVGQTLCIVEAMKVMNEIKAESRNRITKILIENGRPVSAGQPLFQVEPA